VEAVVGHERRIVAYPLADLEDLRHEPDLARLARLAQDRIGTKDGVALLDRIAERLAPRRDRVIGRGDAQDPLRREAGQELLQDDDHIARVLRIADALDDVIDADQHADDFGLECVKLRQLLGDQVERCKAVHRGIADQFELFDALRELVREPIGLGDRCADRV